MVHKIEFKFPTTGEVDEQTTLRLQSLARDSRTHSFAATRGKNFVDYGFDTDKPAEIQSARRTYHQHIRHGAFVVAYLGDREQFFPVGYALALPARETPLAQFVRQLRGQRAAAVLHEINILGEFQDTEFLGEEMALKSMRKFSSQHKAQACASLEDAVMQTVLHDLDFEVDPPYQKPEISHEMFGPKAPPVELYTYTQRGLLDGM